MMSVSMDDTDETGMAGLKRRLIVVEFLLKRLNELNKEVCGDDSDYNTTRTAVLSDRLLENISLLSCEDYRFLKRYKKYDMLDGFLKTRYGRKSSVARNVVCTVSRHSANAAKSGIERNHRRMNLFSGILQS